jgi:hypothetical protein
MNHAHLTRRAGRRFDRDRRRHGQGACAPGNAFNAGIAEISTETAAIAGTAEIAAEIGIAIVTITVITAITTVTVITNRGIAARKES